jgi:hypothetical protein
MKLLTLTLLFAGTLALRADSPFFPPDTDDDLITTDAGVVDWGTLALVGAGLLAIWWVADALSGR